MWTENGTWFSNEERVKGRIAVGQLADLIVPDRDFFACSEHDIAGIVSELTIVGGKVVYGAGPFKQFDDSAPPPAMPDWSPVRTFGGYGGWGSPIATAPAPLMEARAAHWGCAHTSHTPSRGAGGFWGPSGCACWAI
jgi:hypothetical protein